MLSSSFTDREVFELIQKEVSACTGIPLEEVPPVSFSQRPDVADFTMTIAKYAASKKQKPMELSANMVKQINESDKKDIILEAKAEKVFLNFKVNHARIFALVSACVFKLGAQYGSSTLAEPKTVVIEHTSANPNASLHIGNLRSVLIGAHLARLMKWVGYNVKELYFVNDLGAQIGLTAVGYDRINIDDFTADYKLDHLCGYIYSIMNTFNSAQKLGLKISDLHKCFETYKPADDEVDEDKKQKQTPEEEVLETAARLHFYHQRLYDAIDSKFTDDDNIFDLAAKVNLAYENKEPEAVKLIRRMATNTLTGMQQTLDTYDVHHDRFDFESEISWEGTSNALLSVLKQSPFFHPQTQCNAQGKPEGAYLDLDGYLRATGAKMGKGGYQNPYPPFYLLRPDGSTLYTFRDVAYSMKKIGESDMVLNCICTEQNLPQEKVVLTLKALGITQRKQFHTPFELVKLFENGKVKRMSGRKGIYVLADELYDDLKEATRKVMQSRNAQKVDLENSEKMEKITHTVANAAMKYSLLGVSMRAPIDFDIAKAVDPTGNSAAFILYTAARISSIIRKFEEKVAAGEFAAEPKETDWSLLEDDSSAWEILTKYVMNFASEAVRAAFPEIPPEPKLPEFGTHVIPTFAFNLARVFSSYYGRVQIIKADDPAMYTRIQLCRVVLQVLHNAMRVFMVEPLDEM